MIVHLWARTGGDEECVAVTSSLIMSCLPTGGVNVGVWAGLVVVGFLSVLTLIIWLVFQNKVKKKYEEDETPNEIRCDVPTNSSLFTDNPESQTYGSVVPTLIRRRTFRFLEEASLTWFLKFYFIFPEIFFFYPSLDVSGDPNLIPIVPTWGCDPKVKKH